MQDQTYDGAVNMAGKTNGVAAFMLTNNPKKRCKQSCTERVCREHMRSDGALSLP